MSTCCNKPTQTAHKLFSLREKYYICDCLFSTNQSQKKSLYCTTDSVGFRSGSDCKMAWYWESDRRFYCCTPVTHRLEQRLRKDTKRCRSNTCLHVWMWSKHAAAFVIIPGGWRLRRNCFLCSSDARWTWSRCTVMTLSLQAAMCLLEQAGRIFPLFPKLTFRFSSTYMHNNNNNNNITKQIIYL